MKLLLILAAGGLGGGLYKGLQWEEQRRKFRPGSRSNGKYVRHVLPHKIAASIGVAANVTFFTQTMSVSQSSLNNIESISHQSIIWKSMYHILRNSSYTQQYIQFTTCGRPNDKHYDAKPMPSRQYEESPHCLELSPLRPPAGLVGTPPSVSPHLLEAPITSKLR